MHDDKDESFDSRPSPTELSDDEFVTRVLQGVSDQPAPTPGLAAGSWDAVNVERLLARVIAFLADIGAELDALGPGAVDSLGLAGYQNRLREFGGVGTEPCGDGHAGGDDDDEDDDDDHDAGAEDEPVGATGSDRNEFLDHCVDLVKYWRELPAEGAGDDVTRRLSGLAFSILTALDGVSLALLGGYTVVRRRGDGGVDVQNDIAGELHDHWHERLYKKIPHAGQEEVSHVS